jgi:hypothetical protein
VLPAVGEGSKLLDDRVHLMLPGNARDTMALTCSVVKPWRRRYAV